MRAQRVVVGVLLAALVVTSGCVGFLTGSEALSFSASKVTVSDQAQSETGYEKARVESQTVNQSFSVAGQERRVTVTNWIAQYERRVDLGPAGEKRAAVFVALATPKVEIGPKTFNPVADMSTRDLVRQFQSRYSGLQVGSRVGSRTVTALGESRTVDTFEGQATIGGVSVDVLVHVAKFQHEGDFVVVLAVHPERLPDEKQRVDTLLSGLQHGG